MGNKVDGHNVDFLMSRKINVIINTSNEVPFIKNNGDLEQIRVPISDKFMGYAQTVLDKLKNADIRAELDDRNEKIGKKIRDAEIKHIPCMLIVGEKEQAAQQVSFRKQGEGDKGVMSVDVFISLAKTEINNYR